MGDALDQVFGPCQFELHRIRLGQHMPDQPRIAAVVFD
jgi:hypothetical protein